MCKFNYSQSLNPDVKMLYIVFQNVLKFIYQTVQFFQELLPEKREHGHLQASYHETESEPWDNHRARFRVSLNDLKVISSALLHFKKYLLAKKDMERAEKVAEVDAQIYNLILRLEREMEEEHEQVAA